MAVPFDEPRAIVPLLELQECQAQLLHGVEGAHPQQLLLQRPDEPLGATVAFGFADEGGGEMIHANHLTEQALDKTNEGLAIRLNEVEVERTSTIVVMDRGYVDYAWFGQLTTQEVFFVTPLKDNAVYDVVERRPPPERSPICHDEVIRLTGVDAATKCPHLLRRVEIYDAAKDDTLVFLTNHLTFGATTIAAIYKDRWQVELFFKALKQNLKIKTFVGTSANALKVQVWTALIAMLLLRYLQLRSCFAWSLSNLLALLRMNLFTHRDLWAWLDQPYTAPPPVDAPQQEALALA